MTGPSQIVAASGVMAAIVSQLPRLARTHSTILIIGETGTGKELLARAIHMESTRRDRAFLAVNCGAIPQELIEAELFGFTRGAFTSAAQEKAGLVEAAHQGTLFLDEVAELTPKMQVALLRFLESGETRRIGSTKLLRVDVRVVAATNRSLQNDALFRSDLYFRLAVGVIKIPPLRERPEDIVALIEAWLPQIAKGMSRGTPVILDAGMQLLLEHSWPGNARELRNVLERLLVLTTDESIAAHHVREAIAGEDARASASLLNGNQEERTRLLSALDSSRWKMSSAAASLGVSRSTLWRKLAKHRITR